MIVKIILTEYYLWLDLTDAKKQKMFTSVGGDCWKNSLLVLTQGDMETGKSSGFPVEETVCWQEMCFHS